MKGIGIFKEHGLSMIELLVALAISSFLILGITQVYLNNKTSYTFQQAQAANMDSSRFLQMILDEQISRAGYRRTPEQEMEDAFPALSAANGCAAFPVEGAITRLSDTAKSGFCIRYQPAFAGELSCDGVASTLSNGKPFANSSSSENIIVRIEFEGNNNLHEGRLLCNNVELVSGLADFRVQFLQGPKLERRFNDNPYINAKDYAGGDLVRGLSYEALFSSSINQRVGSSSPILDSWLASMTANAKKRLEDNDKGRIYQATSSTQLLRNLVP